MVQSLSVINTIRATWLPALFTMSCTILSFIYLPFIVLAIFGLGDTIARFNEYKRLRHLNEYLPKKVFKRMRYSMCQRNVASAISTIAKEHYKELGYKWYHVLPDGTFTIKDNPYLKIRFYKKLLGIN